MPFQIIETIERGKRLIETVPSTWTRDGYLFWPKKNFLSLKKIEGSIPQHDWKPYPCIILRDNILDYKVAEQEVALMSDATDTDDGHNKENEHPEKTKIALDLNNLVMECIQLNKAAKEVSPMVTAEEAFPRGPSEEASPMVAAKETPPMVAAEEAPPMVSAEEAPPMVAAEDAPSVMVVESNTLMPMDVNNVTVKDPSQVS
ncbi:uncharacterized protein LOC123878491 isoform X2 [Maniola jurtina]|uniref:uncharacterized protein LOC123878491 isoform X2 n=1 Tax=Maniola jurtina TaxID=191418 RepID=UPI001E68A6D4|nr:uncharacterized protein LOC123878491 isoform X2 [Maniola jurtina]